MKEVHAAATRLVLRHPFWAELYYSLTVQEGSLVSTPSVGTLATDGRTLWVNPEFWATMSHDERVAALAHEVGHKMLLHTTRCGARNPRLWNRACDFVVNAILKENGFVLGRGWLYDPRFAGRSAEDVYSELEREQPPQGEDGGGAGEGGEDGEDSGGAGEGGEDGEGRGGGQGQGPQWDDLRRPEGSGEAISNFEKEVMQTVQKALATAKAMGTAPAGMSAFDDVCTPSREPWYNHLHRFMQSLSYAEYNWAKMNRRHAVVNNVFAPDHYSEALGEIVIAIDCSGSVFTAADQANFAGHVNAILAEARPRKVHVMYFDTCITRHDTIEAGELDFRTRPAGGGGTSFVPIFNKIATEGITPDAVVVLTDCYGDYPPAPHYPVLWASIEERVGSYFPPFGDFIFVDPRA